jgi:hypothetical protein
MRNEEPTRADPPPGFTGDLAADVGTSLGGMRAHPERRLEDRSGARREQELAAASESELTTAARARSSQAAQGHIELRRLCGRPC